jgi:hypothetical protein
LKKNICKKLRLNDEIKINKTFTKRWRTRIRNQKNKDWSWNTNNKEDQIVNFKGEERKEDKKSLINNKSPHHHWYAAPIGKERGDASNDMVEGHFWLTRGVIRAT